jgi:hypothetical protein
MDRGARLTLLGVMLTALVACGGEAPKQDKEEMRALGRDTDDTVFDDMIQTQDRARAVEDITLGRKDDLDAELEAAEGSNQ